MYRQNVVLTVKGITIQAGTGGVTSSCIYIEITYLHPTDLLLNEQEPKSKSAPNHPASSVDSLPSPIHNDSLEPEDSENETESYVEDALAMAVNDNGACYMN